MMGLREGRKESAAMLLANQLPGRNTAEDRVVWGKDTKLLNQIQLSAYPDCIGGNLAVLESFIGNHLSGVVGGVHVLPFYPSSADRGFAPLTYKEVDPVFGTWDSIQSVAARGDLCVDFMVNHISAQSEQFKDFVEKGDQVDFPSHLTATYDICCLLCCLFEHIVFFLRYRLLRSLTSTRCLIAQKCLNKRAANCATGHLCLTDTDCAPGSDSRAGRQEPSASQTACAMSCACGTAW
jgi:hypothetical protein